MIAAIALHRGNPEPIEPGCFGLLAVGMQVAALGMQARQRCRLAPYVSQDGHHAGNARRISVSVPTEPRHFR